MILISTVADAEDALVAYFEALPADARGEYAALADLDREFGEDVARELASGLAEDGEERP